MCGKIARLQTLGVHVVGPGDSLELNIDGILRMSPLRKEVVQDAQIDILGFYQPFRHVYGQDWIDFIKAGHDESITFDGWDDGEAEPLTVLGLPHAPSTVPLWLYETHNNIWNRYFKHPDSADRATATWTGQDRAWGPVTSRIAHPATNARLLSSPGPKDLDDVDFTLEAPVSGTASIDVRDFNRIKAQAKTEIQRTWFASRYNEIMKRDYGVGINTDADERPELCFRYTEMVSGEEINGTDDATLGTYLGKTVKRINPNMPRKYFDEHGSF